MTKCSDRQKNKKQTATCSTAAEQVDYLLASLRQLANMLTIRWLPDYSSVTLKAMCLFLFNEQLTVSKRRCRQRHEEERTERKQFHIPSASHRHITSSPSSFVFSLAVRREAHSGSPVPYLRTTSGWQRDASRVTPRVAN